MISLQQPAFNVVDAGDVTEQCGCTPLCTEVTDHKGPVFKHGWSATMH